MGKEEKSRKAQPIFFCLIFLITISNAVSWGKSVDGSAPVRLISSDARSVRAAVSVPKPDFHPFVWEGEKFDRLSVGGWGKTAQAGYPELPVMGFLIQVPESGTLSVEGLKHSSEIIPDLIVCPVPKLDVDQEGQRTERFVRNGKAYSRNTFYPNKIISITRLGDLSGTPVARVEIHPFQWNAATKQLRFCRQMKLKVSFEKSLDIKFSSENPAEKKPWIGQDIFEHIKNRVLLNSEIGLMTIRSNDGKNPYKPKNDTAVAASDTQKRIRIEIKKDGIYRITYADLIAEGLPTSVDPRTFRMFNNGSEVAIRVGSAGSTFVSGDYIEFYGEEIETQFTDTNIYWLDWGEQQGKRMAEVDGSDAGTGTLCTSFYETIHFEENHSVWDATPGAPDTDYWFWEKMTAPVTSNYTLQVHDPVSWEASGTLRYGFQGRSTSGSHHTILKLNGSEVSSELWSGAGVYTQEVSGYQSILQNGSNIFGVELPGDAASVDIVYLNWIEVDYWRQLKAVSNSLLFSITGAGPRRVQVSGFGSSNLLLFDVTDPLAPKRIVGFSVTSEGSTYKAIFSDAESTEKKYWIGTSSAVLSPSTSAIEIWQSSNLKFTSNGADWMVITKKAFLSSVAPLVNFRQSQGYRAKSVAVEDIYNEFNDGIFDPSAIKTFLQYAYQNWAAPAPSYVLLAGDANVDYHDYLGTGKQNAVPPHMFYSSFLIPSDNWYACMGGSSDILPDMYIGRMPASSSAMLEKEVSKVTGFTPNSSDTAGSVLLVSDDETAFENANDALIPYFPSAFSTHKVYLRNYANVDTATNDIIDYNVDTATNDIIDYMDQGAFITNYVGHGSVTNWAGEFVFTNRRSSAVGKYTNDIDLLSNGDGLSFIVAMTCLNGYFCQSYYYCLGEAFMAGQNRGAIGFLAPSGLGYTWEHEILDKELFSTIFDEKNGIMGSAVTEAKIAAYGKGITSDALKMLTLFGDPATVIYEAPAKAPTVTTTAVSDITFQSAKTGGNVTSDGGAAVTSRGVCWGESADPAVGGKCKSRGSGTGAFTVELTDLDDDTIYHVRAYATNTAGTSYGDDISFKTEPFSRIAYVCTDTPTNPCGGKEPCYDTINEAIAGSPVPDVIRVCAGDYFEKIMMDAGKEITVEGSWDNTFDIKGGPTTRIKSPEIKSGAGKFLNLKIVP